MTFSKFSQNRGWMCGHQSLDPCTAQKKTNKKAKKNNKTVIKPKNKSRTKWNH